MKYVNICHPCLSHLWNWLILPCHHHSSIVDKNKDILDVFILVSIMYSKVFSFISQFYICYEVLLPRFGSYPITQSTVPTPNGNTANCQPIGWWPHFVWKSWHIKCVFSIIVRNHVFSSAQQSKDVVKWAIFILLTVFFLTIFDLCHVFYTIGENSHQCYELKMPNASNL